MTTKNSIGLKLFGLILCGVGILIAYIDYLIFTAIGALTSWIAYMIGATGGAAFGIQVLGWIVTAGIMVLLLVAAVYAVITGVGLVSE